MNEIPIEKIAQIIGELYLENRLMAERERVLIEQVKAVELRIANIEAKKDGKKS